MRSLRFLNLQGNNIKEITEVCCVVVIITSTNDLIIVTDVNKTNKQTNKQIESLSGFPQLICLMTGGNPVEDTPGYKQKVLTFLPKLRTLNSVSITTGDREKIRNHFPPIAFGSTSY